jgi:hypothetical protein
VQGSNEDHQLIEQPEAVKQIVQHLGLWEAQMLPPPKITSPPSDYWAAEQIPSYDCIDPDYPFKASL